MSTFEELENRVKKESGITQGYLPFDIAYSMAHALKEIVEADEGNMFGLKGYFINNGAMNHERARAMVAVGLAEFPHGALEGFCLLSEEGMRTYRSLEGEGFYSHAAIPFAG